MTRTLTAAALVAFSFSPGLIAFAPAPAFDVASITPCQPGTPAPPMEHAGITDFISPGGRFTARATTVEFLMEWAYGMQPQQHTGGPSWMSTERYDIVAKAEGNPTESEMKLMVQALLTDRFRLRMHHERRELMAYIVSGGRDTTKLLPPKDGETHGMRFAPQMGANQKIATYRIFAVRYTISQLADTFARQLGSVIVNDTGLDGEYDFSFDLTPDDSTPNPMDPTLLMRALREQIGLTVKSQKAAVDFYLIDGAERVAAGN